MKDILIQIGVAEGNDHVAEIIKNNEVEIPWSVYITKSYK